LTVLLLERREKTTTAYCLQHKIKERKKKRKKKTPLFSINKDIKKGEYIMVEKMELFFGRAGKKKGAITLDRRGREKGERRDFAPACLQQKGAPTVFFFPA